MLSKGPRCQICKFSNIYSKRDVVCRRYPPIRDKSTHAGSLYGWLIVAASGWCGEYQPRPRKSASGRPAKDSA